VAWFGFIANEAALLCQSHFDADAFTVPGQASPDWPKTTPARRSVVAQGTQFAAVLAAIRAGKHILHSGPTGSGKRDVWEQAMAEFDPTFGAETYPYVLFATMDMKLPDLVGKFEFSVEGQRAARVWVDGPLTLAMRAGRRLVVENFDQLPARLLTALVGAMDYGTIALFDSPPNDKEILEMVKARPGFAVDAFTRIPLLYGLSFSPEELAESIDPALLARFARKVDYPGR
jgi:MoxR-like ATPase